MYSCTVVRNLNPVTKQQLQRRLRWMPVDGVPCLAPVPVLACGLLGQAGRQLPHFKLLIVLLVPHS